jgi:hypothetical protein
VIIRRSLRLWVAAWLVFQAASLSAIVPRECCLTHSTPAPASEQKCHEPVSERCVMRASCDGPMAGLLTLIANLGIPTAAFGLAFDPPASSVPASVHEDPLGVPFRPDSPPPRA